MTTTSEKRPAYAVIELKSRDYGNFADLFRRAFADQMEARMEQAIKEAAHTFSYALFDKTSKDSFSPQFSVVLHEAFVKAINDPVLTIADEHLSQVKMQNHRLLEDLHKVRIWAHDVRKNTDKLTISGPPADTQALMRLLDYLCDEMGGV